MTSSESEPKTTRKRSRTASKKAAGDDEAKKQRGRPRVDPQDETGADKRRTQIRLAQRAYRQRKETTIASLKKQVSDLQSTIEDMNKSFLNFNDSVMNLGILELNPELSQALRSTTEQFIALAKASSGEDEANEEDADERLKSPIENEVLFAREAALLPQASQNQADEPTSKKQRTIDIGMGYTKTYYDPSSTSDQAHHIDVNYAYPPPTGSPDQDFMPDNHPSNNTNSNYDLIQFQALVPSHPGSPFEQMFDPPLKRMSMPSPYTFSFNETTFTRRLQRATLECGYHLISNMDVRPTLFKHVFKLSLLYNTPAQLKTKFEYLMRRESDASLEFWQTPFIHLGGAGTHYPRRDETGANVVPKNSWHVHSIGPIRDKLGRSRLESRQGAGDAGLDVDLDGYEGEWFDANDVEGYLQEKGLFIKERATFAEVEYVEVDGLSGAGNGSFVSMPTNEGLPSITNGDPTKDIFPPIDLAGSTKGVQPDLLFGEPAVAESLDLTSPAFSPLPVEAGFDPQAGFVGNVMDLNFDLLSGAPPFGPLANLDTRTQRIANAWYDFNLYDESSGSNSASSTSVGTPSPVTIPLHRPPKVADLTFAGTGRDREVRRRKVVIDVAKLIDEIIMRSVCLGRAPGYRRKDVDRAFKRSIVQVF